jgi:hypothetical protein
LGTYDVKVKRGNKYETRTLQVNRNGTNSFYFSPKKETYWEYMDDDRGIHYITLDMYYNMNTDYKSDNISYGLTYGRVVYGFIGYSASVSRHLFMANVMFMFMEAGFGYSGIDGWVLDIGCNLPLKRVTLNVDYGGGRGFYYVKVGLGYNFKAKK